MSSARYILPFAALIALTQAACEGDTCTTNDDCFKGEVCVKDVGESEGTCDKPRVIVDDMSSPSDMGQDMDMSSPGDMGEEPDLPAGSTLAECLLAGCEEQGNSCVSRGGQVVCVAPQQIAGCIEARTLEEISIAAPVSAVALRRPEDPRALAIVGSDAANPNIVRFYQRDSSASPAQNSSYLNHTMTSPTRVLALARYDLDATSERLVAATSSGADPAQQQLDLLWAKPAGAEGDVALSLMRGWRPDDVEQNFCPTMIAPYKPGRALCAGEPMQLSAAPQQNNGLAPDLILSACFEVGAQRPALIQVRPADAADIEQPIGFSTPLSTCDAQVDALSISELDTNLGGNAGSGHIWTLSIVDDQPSAARYDWLGSDVPPTISSEKFAHIQYDDLSDNLLLTPVREACGADAAARWETTAPGLLLASPTNRDELLYFGVIGSRAAVIRRHITADATRPICDTRLEGLRWIDAVATESGWLAVGKKEGVSGVVVVRGTIGEPEDRIVISVISSAGALEPLELVHHRDGATSLLVREGDALAHLYLNEDGAPECAP